MNNIWCESCARKNYCYTTNIKPKYVVQDYTQLKNIILEGLEDVIANKGKV